MKASKVLLLLAILGFGASVETAWLVRHHLGFGPFGFRVLGGEFYGPSFSFDAEERQELPAGGRVEVDNAFGAVRVHAGEPGVVAIHVRKVVFLPTQEKAGEFASRIRVSAVRDGSVLRVSTNRSEITAAWREREVGFETHLELSLPPDTPLAVRSEHGRIEVADVASADLTGSFDEIQLQRVKGDARVTGRHGAVSVVGVGGGLTLSARHGDVTVEDVKGSADVDNQHGAVTITGTGPLKLKAGFGELRLAGIRGDVEVDAEHAGVNASDVAGRCQVKTSFESVRLERISGDVRLELEHGEVHASDVKGALFAKTSFDGVTLERIGGHVEVHVGHGGVRAADLEQGAQVRASGDDVTLDGFRGAVDVEVERGSVELRPEGPLTDAVSARASHGGVTLGVPPDSRFQLEAEAEHGELQLDVPGLTLTSNSGGRAVGTLGAGGSPVKLRALRGEIRLEAKR